jgi:hypothetical protein
MNASRCRRCLACALLALSAGALPLVLEPPNALADQRTKDQPAQPSSWQQQRAEEAEEWQAVMAELEQALEKAEDLMHHRHHHHKGSSFDKGLEQVADYLADEDQQAPPLADASSGSPGTSSGSTSSPGAPLNNSSKGSPTTRGKGSFTHGGHHFGEWWHKKHHHHHPHHDYAFHDRPWNDEHAGKSHAFERTITTNLERFAELEKYAEHKFAKANKTEKATTTTEKTTTTKTKPPGTTPVGQQTAGNHTLVTKPPTTVTAGNNTPATKPHTTVPTKVSSPTTVTAGKSAGTSHLVSAGHFTTTHVGASVGIRPTTAHQHHVVVDRRKK